MHATVCANCGTAIVEGPFGVYVPDNERGDQGHWDTDTGWHHLDPADGEDPSVCEWGFARDPDADHATPQREKELQQ